jgi:hypothetical protein
MMQFLCNMLLKGTSEEGSCRGSLALRLAVWTAER